MNYSFDISIAEKYGVDEAIMIQNFVFWIWTVAEEIARAAQEMELRRVITKN